jgi:hypothetical protein
LVAPLEVIHVTPNNRMVYRATQVKIRPADIS